MTTLIFSMMRIDLYSEHALWHGNETTLYIESEYEITEDLQNLDV